MYFKKTFLVLVFIVGFFQVQLFAIKPTTKNVFLVSKIVGADSAIYMPVYDTSLQLRTVTLNYQDAKNPIFIYYDSVAIEKFHLSKYRVIVNGDQKESFWTSYPIKELYQLKKSKNEVLAEGSSENASIVSEKIVIINQYVLFSSVVAKIIYAVLIIGFLVVIYFWITYRIAQEKYLLETEISNRTQELSEQKRKYEELLTNYLPKEDFEKLQESTKEKTLRFKMVTVLFSNILGFNEISEQESAEKLVDDLDRFFFEFDEVVQRFHIEKIKTIGDSYICAGGIPQKNRTNPIEVVLAAFEMQQFMNSIKDQYTALNHKTWDLRMGIHTGPVFSNVTTNKKRLEIWGDTVNIASRMEASGEIGKVNITGMTYELVKDYFLCKYRGKMPVKYKGEIDMYFIEGFRPALSIEGFGLKPNKAFDIRLALVRFDDLEEHVMNLLEEKLPRNLYYHNLKHTIDVTVQVELIGRGENITEEELLLLKTAALFHDTGFTRVYKDHEEAGVEISKEILPHFDYTEEQIQKISELIMVTKMPPKPKNLLEQIICDSDLDYLGRVDFIPVSGNLFRELSEHKIIENDIKRWNQIQISFIEKHQYFTETAKRLRDVNKNIQLEAIRKLVEENN